MGGIISAEGYDIAHLYYYHQGVQCDRFTHNMDTKKLNLGGYKSLYALYKKIGYGCLDQ